MMVGNNLKDTQLQQIVDKTILFADKDEDGKINFEEFCSVSISCLNLVLVNSIILNNSNRHFVSCAIHTSNACSSFIGCHFHWLFVTSNRLLTKVKTLYF
jgi:hypothetical protein